MPALAHRRIGVALSTCGGLDGTSDGVSISCQDELDVGVRSEISLVHFNVNGADCANDI